MITADKLKVPIRAKVGKINSFYLYQPNPIIYFTGIRFEWCQCELTEILINDLSRIFETTEMKEWNGKEIEVFSRDGQVRARCVNPKVQNAELP